MIVVKNKNSLPCAKYAALVKQVLRQHDREGYAFLDLPDDAGLVKKITSFAAAQKKNNWENIVVLGIGGSSLGLIAIQEALLGSLHNLTAAPRLFVVDNIDPAYTAELMDALEPEMKKTLFIVISKSGTTTEPMVLYAVAKERLLKTVGKNHSKHFVFITDPKAGLLRDIGARDGIAMFDVPPGVGGRFSVLSAVGLLPAALAGVDITGLMKGARAMREHIGKTGGQKNPALVLACAQYHFDREKGKSMTVVMPYSNALFRVGDWYRQLLAESLGKNVHTGPTPINALGTTDQHSQLQLYAEGPDDKWFIFLRVLKHSGDVKIGRVLPGEMAFLNGKTMSRMIDAAYQGTAAALTKNGRPNLTLEIDRIDAPHLGMLFMLFEFQVALLGLMYKVNAFNQPGVEQSKLITKKILSKQ